MGKQTLPSSLRPAPEQLERVHFFLFQWYAAARRDLPWRSTDDPYAILVSEMMLQQTQVERVVPKFQTFLATFPTLAALAAAPTADVISTWVPLGYNMRAVRLQSIARQVIAEAQGYRPLHRWCHRLLCLPQAGRYGRYEYSSCFTSCFSRPGVSCTQAQRFTVTQACRAVLPPGEAYNWNQALMDL